MLTISEMEAKIADLKAHAGEHVAERRDYQNLMKTLSFYNESCFHDEIEYELEIPLNFRARNVEDTNTVYGLYRPQTVYEGGDEFRIHYIVSNSGHKQTQINPASLEMMTGYTSDGFPSWQRVFRRVDKQPMPIYSHKNTNDYNNPNQRQVYSTHPVQQKPTQQQAFTGQQQHFQQQFADKMGQVPRRYPNERDNYAHNNRYNS